MAKMFFVFDFDKTITQADTINTLVSGFFDTLPPHERLTRSATWDAILVAYATDYSAVSRPPNPLLAAHSAPISHADILRQYSNHQSALAACDNASVQRVTASRVLAGGSPEGFHAIGQRAFTSGCVSLRPGFIDFFIRLLRNKAHDTIDVAILSINWSAAFIRGVLAAALAAEQHADSAGLDLKALEVYSNNISADGAIMGSLNTASDKLAKLESLVGAREVKWSQVFYFGDSETDLLALAKARGVIVGGTENGHSLRDKLAAYLDISKHDIKATVDAEKDAKAVELNTWAEAESYFLQ